MATISRIKIWNTGDTLTPADLNAEFNNIINDYNGNIKNANIASDAAIEASKLDSNILTTTNTKTVTNKTLAKPKLIQPYTDIVTATDGATITFDLSQGHIQQVTLGGNRTLTISNAQVGSAFALKLIQDASGNRTVTWFSTIKWAGGVAPTLTPTANKADWFGFICTGANTYDGFVIAMNL
jgi:hypothetical protein